MEQTNLLNEFSEPTFEYASAGQRFVNYLIDIIIFYVLMFIVGIFIGIAAVAGVASTESITITILTYVFAIAFFLLYYTLLEGSKGKTLGKLVSKTKVVTEDGTPMTYNKAFVRSLSRLVPFEPLSVFFGVKMWHDQWTNTMVVKDN
jgi:uncharacterized RDD family membrane protein YckC